MQNPRPDGRGLFLDIMSQRNICIYKPRFAQRQRIITLIYRELPKVCNLQFYQIESFVIKRVNRRFVRELHDDFPEILPTLGIAACHSATGRFSCVQMRMAIWGRSHRPRKNEKVLSKL